MGILGQGLYLKCSKAVQKQLMQFLKAQQIIAFTFLKVKTYNADTWFVYESKQFLLEIKLLVENRKSF